MIVEWLERRLEAGGFVIGQVRVSAQCALRHVADAGVVKDVFTRAADAREIARSDEAGNYRPLKTAPNLRRGWELRLDSADAVRQALDFIYPAALGTWLAHERGDLDPVNLRETLGRQTGMYRVTQLITDEQAEEVIRARCHPETGCLRTQLWAISASRRAPFTKIPDGTRDALPILCAEACNLLVADCRPVAKGNLPKTSGT